MRVQIERHRSVIIGDDDNMLADNVFQHQDRRRTGIDENHVSVHDQFSRPSSDRLFMRHCVLRQGLQTGVILQAAADQVGAAVCAPEYPLAFKLLQVTSDRQAGHIQRLAQRLHGHGIVCAQALKDRLLPFNHVDLAVFHADYFLSSRSKLRY